MMTRKRLKKLIIKEIKKHINSLAIDETAEGILELLKKYGVEFDEK